ncbi:MAG: LLM class F420-dependent oxidoreductase [Dehalococcoidia bacterium]|nr:LLM class F420-dependent oxidoreductase [Dehalococcoidia bacterium]
MSHPREPRFGIATGPQYVEWSTLKDYWQAADDLGFQTAFTFDHFMPINPGGKKGANWVEDTCLEGWTTLTALGALTKQIRVGCLVTGVTYRHPAVLANMAATVDHIVNGRLEFGIGAAWYELEHKQYGIEFPPAGERIRRLDEALEVCRRLWTERRATFHGRYYSLTDALCEPKPIQKPYPPILVGGSGPKLLRVVAKHADIWHSFGTIDTFTQKLDILRAHCAELGRDYDAIEKSTIKLLIMADTAAELERATAMASAIFRQPVEQLKRQFCVGTPDEVAAQLQEYIDLGVTHFQFGTIPEYQVRPLEVFAREVMPRFRPVTASS